MNLYLPFRALGLITCVQFGYLLIVRHVNQVPGSKSLRPPDLDSDELNHLTGLCEQFIGYINTPKCLRWSK